ncbi:hypothetical protein KIN20_000767 [Parelaphostrongylus tenuis]|uniref:Lipoprotein n=1 Tax=Parelaphostrongylus tenuis TaxID=148309 RepID=A0AAD5LT15_PARTN|nr:hypothetical protein KIN20_000767 [Parelaphostrongylus tenuis]
MKKLSLSLFSLLATVADMSGCGVMPEGQAMTRNFTVTGFRLPTAMVFTASSSAAAQLPGGIAATSDGVKSFVSRLVMQTITYRRIEFRAVARRLERRGRVVLMLVVTRVESNTTTPNSSPVNKSSLWNATARLSSKLQGDMLDQYSMSFMKTKANQVLQVSGSAH